MGGMARSHFVAAVVGGAIVAGVFTIIGVADRQRPETIVEEAPAAAPAAPDPGGRLTPHAIYARSTPAVVAVNADIIDPSDTPFGFAPNDRSDTSSGSGFLVDRRGDVLTNFHLIDGADRSAGVSVQFEDGVTRVAGVAAVDPTDDLAVLRIDMRGLQGIRPLSLGDSSSVRVGDPILALGAPFGADRTLTSGIVSALQHQIEAADGKMIDNVIQTDQPLDAGNSGGPLLNASGQVVGINSQVATAGPTQRLSFAIPIDTADSVLARVDHTALHLAYIGIAAGRAGGRAGGRGAVVGEVTAGGPAALAGLQHGDVIQRVDSIPVNSINQVLALVSTRSPGQNLALQVRRGHGHRSIQVVLGSRTVPAPGS
jgi:S1-C subfamily serine protease